jgi:hypothetical protein
MYYERQPDEIEKAFDRPRMRDNSSSFGDSVKIIVPSSWLRKRVIAFLHSEFISSYGEERKSDE